MASFLFVSKYLIKILINLLLSFLVCIKTASVNVPTHGPKVLEIPFRAKM